MNTDEGPKEPHPPRYDRITAHAEFAWRGVDVIWDMTEDEVPLPFNAPAAHLTDDEQVMDEGGNVICLCFEIALVCRVCGRSS